MKQSGFMLIDVVVYLALSVLLSLFVLSFCQHGHSSILAMQQRLRSFVTDTIVLDVVRRELCALDQQPAVHDWKHTVYKVQTLDQRGNPQEFSIGWRVHERGIVRIQGQYDRMTATWKSKTETLLLSFIKTITLMPQLSADGKNVVGVNVHLEQGAKGNTGYALDDCVAVRNGVVV
ncbi:MAG: hypothetical protein WCT20_03790 [Candidatus Babeliales bacterium]|jgi:hypothetical protein